MAKKSRGEIFVANTTGDATYKGETAHFARGRTRVRAGHWLVREYPMFFDPIGDEVHFDVEQATAAPGEKRGDGFKRDASSGDDPEVTHEMG